MAHFRFGMLVSYKKVRFTPDKNAIYHLPKSMVQIPVPQPASRTLFKGFSSPAGQRSSLLLRVSRQQWCCRSGIYVSIENVGIGLKLGPKRSFSNYIEGMRQYRMYGR